MDIVMNTSFANSLLPRAPMPGFSDNFDRAVAPLGATSGEGRAWQYFSNGEAPLWRTSSGGTAVLVSGAALNAAVVDALASNGTYKVTAASLGSNRRGGPALRFRDMDNHLFLWQPAPADPIALYKRVGGTATRIGEAGSYVPTNGDVYTVELSGPNVIVKVNGTTRITAIEPALQGETRFGLIGTSSALQMGWDDISFTP